MRRIVPLLDRVLVERVKAPTKSMGGVLLPESSAGKLNEVWFSKFSRLSLTLVFVHFEMF